MYFLIAISTGFFKPRLSFESSFVLIRSEWTAFSKKLLKGLAILDSSEIISSFRTNDILRKVGNLSDKDGFTVFQNFLLSVTLEFHNIFFFRFYIIFCRNLFVFIRF